jgi:hypothetical protein
MLDLNGDEFGNMSFAEDMVGQETLGVNSRNVLPRTNSLGKL